MGFGVSEFLVEAALRSLKYIELPEVNLYVDNTNILKKYTRT